jgi:hypothetical protein
MEFNPTTRKAITLVLLVFVLGVAIGAVGISLVNRRVYGALGRPQAADQPRPGDQRPKGRTRLVKNLTVDLDLNAEQQKELTSILENTQSRYDAIRQQMNPQFDEVRQQSRDHIRQILTPEQRPKFDDFMRRVDEEHHRKLAH